MEAEQARRVKAAQRWFAQHGYRLAFHEGDGYVWADRVTGRWVFRRVFRRYGRGPDRASAAERAMRRWREEQ